MPRLNLSEESLIEDLLESAVPVHMHDAYVNYILHGRAPGHFLTAVLENDLREACGGADADNQRALFQHVSFLYNYAPSPCWGSPEKVQAWIAWFARQRGEAD